MSWIERLNAFWETAESVSDENGKVWITNPYLTREGGDLMDELWDKMFQGCHWNLEGRCKLEEAGYTCHDIERDSFGLVIAGLSKDGKTLMFA